MNNFERQALLVKSGMMSFNPSPLNHDAAVPSDGQLSSTIPISFQRKCRHLHCSTIANYTHQIIVYRFAMEQISKHKFNKSLSIKLKLVQPFDWTRLEVEKKSPSRHIQCMNEYYLRIPQLAGQMKAKTICFKR